MEPTQLITINSRKYDQSIRRSWNCELLKHEDSLLVFVGVFDVEVSHPDIGFIKKGTISYEFYWLDRWYNIFSFHEPDGTFRNYYCNIATPPTFENGVLDYVDLDIDVLVWPGSTYKILDESEFEENALKYKYPDALRTRATLAVTELIQLIDNRRMPVPDFLVNNLA